MVVFLIFCHRPLRKYEIREEREKVHRSKYTGWFHVNTLWYLLLDCYSVDIIFYQNNLQSRSEKF